LNTEQRTGPKALNDSSPRECGAPSTAPAGGCIVGQLVAGSFRPSTTN